VFHAFQGRRKNPAAACESTIAPLDGAAPDDLAAAPPNQAISSAERAR